MYPDPGISTLAEPEVRWAELSAEAAVRKILAEVTNQQHRVWVTVMVVPRESVTTVQMERIASYNLHGVSQRARRRIRGERNKHGLHMATQLRVRISQLKAFAKFLEQEGSAFIKPVTPCGRGQRRNWHSRSAW